MGEASLSDNKKEIEGSTSELYWLLDQKLVRMKPGERSLHLGGRYNDDL